MTTQKKQINLLDYLLVVGKWKNFLLISTIIVGILAIGVSLLLTKYYKASVLFLPPTTSSGLTSLIQNFSVDLLSSDEISGDVCLSILRSRELREEIIRKYNLMNVYKKEYMEHALKALDKNVMIDKEIQVGIGASSIISVSINVVDKLPQRAADIANDFYNLLEKEIIALNTQKAKNHRLFLEKRVTQNMADLDAAEDSLKNFQKKYGAIEITSQAKVAIEAAAAVKAQMVQTEITRESMRPFLSNSHSEMIKLDKEISALKKEYKKMHLGGVDEINNDVLLPLDAIPDLGLQYYRLLREVEIQNTLYEMLVPLLEQAKIREAKEIPVLRLIDRATPPTYKFKPKRAFVVVGIVAIYLAFCLLYIFYVDYISRLKVEDIEQYKKIKSIYSLFSFRKKAN